MFDAANVYLGTKISPTARRIKASKNEREKEVEFGVDKDEEIVDWFDGVRFSWVLVSSTVVGEKRKKKKRESGNGLVKSEVRCFELRFHKKHKELILTRYHFVIVYLLGFDFITK